MSVRTPEQGAERPGSAPTKAAMAGLLVMAGFFVGLGGWAATAPLDSAVLGFGQVVVETDRQAVEHPDGGLVAGLLVRDGDRVARGDLLLRLDDREARATVQALAERLTWLRARSARFAAERDGAPSLDAAGVGLDADGDDLSRRAIREEATLLAARRAALNGEKALRRQQISELTAALAGYEAQHRAHVRQLEIVAVDLKGSEDLSRQGLEPKRQLRQHERDQAFYQGKAAETAALISQTREGIATRELEIAQIQADYAAEIAAQSADLSLEIAQLEPRLLTARLVLERTRLRAPRDGVVFGLSVSGPGSVIKPGDTVLELVPQDERLLVEAAVNPADIEDLRPGMSASLTLTAYKVNRLPKIEALVTKVSADRVEEPQTGAAYYLVHLALRDEEVLGRHGVVLYPGMPVEVIIPTGARNALDYLVSPLRDSLRRSFIED